MNGQPWPDELRQKLHRQNLPPAYIDRLVEELSDHLIDSQEEHSSMEAQDAFVRLGNTNTIAATASHDFPNGKAGSLPWRVRSPPVSQGDPNCFPPPPANRWWLRFPG